MERKEALKNNKVYRLMQRLTTYLDKYYLDAIAGLVPGGVGDIIGALFGLVHVYFSLFFLHSLPLTFAILNNSLRDVLVGMIPFYVGDVIDFFHKANRKNMALIDGFINDDQEIIHAVNRKAWQFGLSALAFVLMILAMLALLVWLAEKVAYVFV